jgi:hypothetical protein
MRKGKGNAGRTTLHLPYLNPPYHRRRRKKNKNIKNFITLQLSFTLIAKSKKQRLINFEK